jgi:hypothetical protein
MRARLLHRSIALAKVTQVIDGLTSSIDHADLEVDGCEASLWESRSGAGSRYLEVFLRAVLAAMFCIAVMKRTR